LTSNGAFSDTSSVRSEDEDGGGGHYATEDRQDDIAGDEEMSRFSPPTDDGK